MSLFCLLFLVADTKVHKVTFDSGVGSKKHLAYVHECDTVYEIASSKEAPASRRYYKIDAPESFEVATGVAVFQEPGAERDGRFRFWTVPDKAAAEAFVRRLLDARGSDAKIAWTDSERSATIRVPPQGSKRWPPLYFRQEGNLIAVSSSATLHKISLEPLQKWVRVARGAHRMQVWIPQAVPDKQRSDFVAAILRTVRLNAQQADDESSEDYLRRRQGSQAVEVLVRSFFESVEEVLAVERWPHSDAAEYAADVSVKFAPQSELARLLSSCRGGSAIQLPGGENTALYVRVAAKLPKVLQQFLQTVVSAHFLDAPWHDDALELAKLETLDVTAAWLASGDQLAVVGSARDTGAGVWNSLVRKLLHTDGGVNSAGQDPVRLLLDRYIPAGAPATWEETAYHFGSLSAPGFDRSAYPTVMERRSVRPLLEVGVCLSQAVGSGDGNGLRKLFVDLERAYDRSVFDAQMARIANGRSRSRMLRMLGLRETHDPNDFVSLREKVGEGKELKGRFRLTATQRELRLSVRGHRDLHQLFVARDRLARQRLKLK